MATKLLMCEYCDDTLFYHSEDLFLSHLEGQSHKDAVKAVAPGLVTPHMCEACDSRFYYPTYDEFLVHLASPGHHKSVKVLVPKWLKERRGILLNLGSMPTSLRATLIWLGKVSDAWFKNAYCHQNHNSNGGSLLIVWYINEALNSRICANLNHHKSWTRYHPIVTDKLRILGQLWNEIISLDSEPEPRPSPPAKITVEQLEAELEFMKSGKKGKPTFYDQDASYHDGTGHPRFGFKELQPYTPKRRNHHCSFSVSETGLLIRELPCNEFCPLYAKPDATAKADEPEERSQSIC